MLWTLPFALLLLAVVVLRYWQPWAARCPECSEARADASPVCGACGWIYELPDEADDLDYGDEPEETGSGFP
jgi:hypothetical protein